MLSLEINASAGSNVVFMYFVNAIHLKIRKNDISVAGSDVSVDRRDLF